MNTRLKTLTNALTGTAVAAALLTPFLPTRADDDHDRIRHVLLISIDGFHGFDLRRCEASGLCPNLARLAEHGTTYSNASTTKPSDSFPGMLAQVTGGTSKSTGVFYDDSYDRTLFAPAGHPPAPCASGPGAETNLAENTDTNLHAIYGGVSASLTGLNSAVAIDPNNLPGQLSRGVCAPVWPHNFVRTNTIFEVIHRHHMRTAWSDKHPAYEDLAGPSGKGLDELYAPEINSQDTLDAGAQEGDDYTTSYTGVRTYDSLKVQAVLNWIDGHDGTGKKQQAVPAIFGMNFQAVSVGQKLAKAGDADTDKSLTGGYADAQATPGNALTLEFQFVDDALGKFINELKAKNLEDSTLIIVSAKHGQSPINVKDRVAISDALYSGAPGFGANGFEICDDAALVWLSPELQQATNPATGHPYYADAKAYIQAHATALHIEKLLDRDELTRLYEDPFQNSRVPDFIAITDHGVICTGGTKLAEHGGFSNDDRNVALLVSSPRIKHARIVEDTTFTTQIAPTILDALDLDPRSLQAVREEGVQVLK